MPDKAIFMDRDNTLVEDPGYINHPDQVKLIDGVPEALVELRSMGYNLVVVSNQSGVARGIVTEKVLAQIHDRLRQLLAEKGAYIDKIYYCPYLADGVIEKYRVESEMRKPNPGMLLRAAEELHLDLSQCWMVGDGARDIEAGRRAGCKTIMLDSPGHTRSEVSPGVSPDYRAVNMKEAVNIIKKDLHNTAKPPQPSEPVEPQQGGEPSQTTIPAEPIAAAPPPEAEKPPEPKTEELLTNILDQLKSMHRTSMFAEFSIARMFAGIVQGLVVLCLVIAVWFLLSPNRQANAVLISLGFAVVLQAMALTLYVTTGRR